ncbi:MAG: branched-chain amino acid ABC transporter permease [Anaerolineales bacterium]
MTRLPPLFRESMRSALIGGSASLLLALVGMVESFHKRLVINEWFSVGQVLFLLPIWYATFVTLRRFADEDRKNILLASFLAGAVGSIPLVLLLLIGSVVNLRAVLVNASPALYKVLAFNQENLVGSIVLLLVSGIITLTAGWLLQIHPRWQRALIQGFLWVFVAGLMRDLILTVTNRWGPFAIVFQSLFAPSGLTQIGGVLLFALVTGISYWRYGKRSTTSPKTLDPKMRWGILAGVALLFIFLPQILGLYFSEILDNVMMYILMGLGLNIVVGYAGLLDLGYVAFFAIGAYTMGVLTSPELNAQPLTYWQALPFAMIISVFSGIILGLPVLKLRGDYLAIVTLGFGEIVRLLVLSDWLRPWLGGTQGIQLIAQPKIGNLVLKDQVQLYYLFLAGVAIVLFIAWRLKDSHLGRSWMALREDEDVARAMGVNHVTTKLLAFGTGALFSGIAGTIFAAKLTSVYPHSMNFLVSINVLGLIILGGMGSIPGVFVGALVLIGAPELLREFAEYRYLVYGALLVAMMLYRPEGLWPEARRRLELHEEEVALEGVPSPSSAD